MIERQETVLEQHQTRESPTTVRQPVSLTAFLALTSAQRLAWVRSYPGASVSRTWRVARFLAFSRPRTCVPGMLAFYVACVVHGVSGNPVSTADLLAGLVVSYHIAAIANLYNLYTDIVEDNENIPTRVFELGLYGRERLLRHTHLLTTGVFVVSLLVNFSYAGLTLLALIGCQQYSFGPMRMKARPRVGILYFANAVAYPYASAALASTEQVRAFADPKFSALGLYLFVWFCAKGLIKNVPDYDGDKRVNVTTSATLSSSRRSAAVVAAAATIAVYAGIVIPVALGFIEPRYLFGLVWLPVACLQARRLVAASAQASWNDMLRDDMVVSVGYLSTLILIEDLALRSVAVVAAGLTIMVLADRLGLDTRRKDDFATIDPLA